LVAGPQHTTPDSSAEIIGDLRVRSGRSMDLAFRPVRILFHGDGRSADRHASGQRCRGPL